ncbi:MAG TPA: MauE/DoxX family redox-associated membrane protein [Acidimicrobiales bacterium]|nr:MauE/DoxX family redox-associated membrane protein [Acidimicrobiales bacterium]
MTDLARACALVLALLFAWAAVAKVVAHSATVEAFAGLLLPAPAVLAIAVPVVEVAVAAGLVLRPDAVGWTAIALLAGFSAVIVRAQAKGVSTGCACFGAPSSADPVSAADLVRNAALAAVAVVATGCHDARWPSPLAGVSVVVLFIGGAVALGALRRRLAV